MDMGGADQPNGCLRVEGLGRAPHWRAPYRRRSRQGHAARSQLLHASIQPPKSRWGYDMCGPCTAAERLCPFPRRSWLRNDYMQQPPLHSHAQPNSDAALMSLQVYQSIYKQPCTWQGHTAHMTLPYLQPPATSPGQGASSSGSFLAVISLMSSIPSSLCCR